MCGNRAVGDAGPYGTLIKTPVSRMAGASPRRKRSGYWNEATGASPPSYERMVLYPPHRALCILFAGIYYC